MFLLTLNISVAQDLSYSNKRKVKKELKLMLKTDQEYRGEIAKNPSLNKDSLWQLQSINDSLNKDRLISIIKDYGFPSGKRTGSDLSQIITLHLTKKEDFEELKILFLSELNKGNIEAVEYARWFDRCLINMKKPNKYGEYGKKKFCGEELIAVNKSRLNIGLAKLSEAPNCP